MSLASVIDLMEEFVRIAMHIALVLVIMLVFTAAILYSFCNYLFCLRNFHHDALIGKNIIVRTLL